MDETKYCFLSYVYEIDNSNSEKEEFYELALADKKFRNIQYVTVNKMGLLPYVTNSSLIKDFNLEKNYLQASSIIPKIQCVPNILQSINKIVDVRGPQTYTLYDFLDEGLQNNFFFVHPELVTCDFIDSNNRVGDGITPFNNVKFSQSSMSVYVHISYENALQNLYLVKYEKNCLNSKQFFFVTPVNYDKEPTHCIFKKEVTINNRLYRLYEAPSFNICSNFYSVPAALVNKAVNICFRGKEMVKALNCLKNKYLEYENSKTWVGESSQKSTLFGVKFISSEKKIRNVSDFVNECLALKERIESYEDFITFIEKSDKTLLEKFIAKNLGIVLYNSENIAEIISNCDYLKNKALQDIYYADSFSYCVRAFLVLAKKEPTSFFRTLYPVLYGSDEPNVTIIEKGVY